MDKRYAVLIGIDDNDIKGCSNDVEDIRSMLETIYHIPSRNIITITREKQNESLLEMKSDVSMHEQIKNSIAVLLEIARREDIVHVWFHVSSHGKQIAYKRSSIFKIEEGKYISSKWITRELSKLPKSCDILMTFDYCHSGYYHQLPYMYEMHPRGMLRRTIKVDNGNNTNEIHPRMFCIASTSNGYSSDVLYEEADGFRGAFTKALLDGLKHHRYKVELPTLFDTIQKIMRIRNHEQQPRLFSSSMDPYEYFILT